MHPPRLLLAAVAVVIVLIANGSAALPVAQAPVGQPLELPRILEAARGIAAESVTRGLPVEDAADATSLVVTDLLRARHENPALVDRVGASIRLEMLASAPASAPLDVGALHLSRPAARASLGSRAGRDRLAVIDRLRAALPSQTAAMTDDDLLALLPELVRAAQPVDIPADMLAPIRLALAQEAPQ